MILHPQASALESVETFRVKVSAVKNLIEQAEVMSEACVKTRVLIVDDTKQMRKLLKMMLGNHFEIVGEADDGDVGVLKAKQLVPDLVILDMRMPKMNGLEASRLIRSHLPKVKILILSAYEDNALAKEAKEAGADAYLVKGMPNQDFLHRVNNLMKGDIL